jgi:hypothetical protein
MARRPLTVAEWIFCGFFLLNATFITYIVDIEVRRRRGRGRRRCRLRTAGRRRA